MTDRNTETEPLASQDAAARVLDAALAWYRAPGPAATRALRQAVAGWQGESLPATGTGAGEKAPGASGTKAPRAGAEPKTSAGASAATPEAATVRTRPQAAGQFEIYSDGSALNNPGPAGCGWVVLSGQDIVYEGFESLGVSTNQVAEIRAAAHGLNDLPAGSVIDVYTDSLYVVQTMKGAFRKKANLEHWAFLDEAVRRHATVRFHHVKGHNGHHLNERADKLANQGALRSKTRLA